MLEMSCKPALWLLVGVVIVLVPSSKALVQPQEKTVSSNKGIVFIDKT